MGAIGDTKGGIRRRKLFELLKTRGKLSIAEAAEALNCSIATARRDIELLERSGSAIRTPGGVRIEGGLGARELPFHEKSGLLFREKAAIAQKAASLVEEGDIVGLTGGSTTFMIARELKALQRRITVVTNAVNIAADLADSEEIQVVVTGGVMRSKSFELCGPLAEKTLEGLNLTKMFLGVDGFTLDRGFTTYSETEARVNQLLMERAQTTFAVFDHTKYGKVSLFPIAGTGEVDGIITNQSLPSNVEEALRGIGKPRWYTAEAEGEL